MDGLPQQGQSGRLVLAGLGVAAKGSDDPLGSLEWQRRESPCLPYALAFPLISAPSSGLSIAAIGAATSETAATAMNAAA